jgi:hypothetical protein
MTSPLDSDDTATAGKGTGQFLTAIKWYWAVAAPVDHHCRLMNCSDFVGDVIGVHQRRNGLGYASAFLSNQMRQPRPLVLRAVQKQLQERTGGGIGIAGGEAIANLAHLC